MLVIKTPINSFSRHEVARNVEPIDLELPWQNVAEIIKDKDFVQLTITTKNDSFVVMKDSSW